MPTTKLYAVRPTQAIDQVTLDAIGNAGSLAAGYTNSTFVRLGGAAYLCAYNKTSGAVDVYALTDAAPWIQPVESRISVTGFPLPTGETDQGGPWDNLSSFVLGGETYLLMYRAHDGTFGFFKLGADLSASAPYSVAMPRNTPTPGFTTVAPVTSLGSQYVLGYNFNDGTVAVYSVSVVTPAPGQFLPLNLLNVWYHKWAAKWTHFAFFQMGGANFFFKINVGKLNVNIDHLQDNPALGSVEVGSYLQGKLPDAKSVDNAAIVPWSDGDPRLITYIASSGATVVYRIHGDCQGWTSLASATTVLGASLMVPYRLGDSSYVLFYGDAQ